MERFFLSSYDLPYIEFRTERRLVDLGTEGGSGRRYNAVSALTARQARETLPGAAARS
jgi:hypothetical protein